MDSILNTQVSCFRSYNSPSNPININLLTWLKSNKHAEKVNLIRQLVKKSERDKEKAKLPGITPSGVFTYRLEENLVKHSGFLQFDIDFKANLNITNYNKLKEQICNIKNVAYCGLSVSGTGYWGLIPIAYPDKHKLHFSSLYKAFKSLGIVLDAAPASVASLRGYSYDSEAYFNHHATIFDRYDKPAPKLNPTFYTHSLTDEQKKVEACISEIERRKIDITTSYCSDWLPIASNFAETFGEAGRTYFNQISQFHPEFDYRKANRQYDQCIRNIKGLPSLGTFFNRCAAHGISYKEVIFNAKSRGVLQ